MKDKNNSVIILVLAVALMGMFGFNIYQGYRYERLCADVRKLEAEQEKWFERNKEDFEALSSYRSPQRLKELKKDLNLSTARDGQTIIVKTRSGVDSNAERKE